VTASKEVRANRHIGTMERLRQWRQCHWPNDEEDEGDDDSETDILEVWDEKRGDYDVKADEDFDQWSRNSSRHEEDELDELDDDESMSAAYNEPFCVMQRDTVNEESAYDEDDASISSSNSSISSLSSSSHLSRFCRRRERGAAKKVASVSFDRSTQEAALDNENGRYNADDDGNDDDDDDDAMDAWSSSTSSRSNNGHGGIPHDRIHQHQRWSSNDVFSIASNSSSGNSSSHNNHAGNSQWSNHDVARADELVPPVQSVAKLVGNRESSPIDLMSSNGNDGSDCQESNVPSVASRKNDRGVDRMTTEKEVRNSRCGWREDLLDFVGDYGRTFSLSMLSMCAWMTI
jgi:hypothetical protein